MENKKFFIEGMHCESCVKLIKEEFKKVKEIQNVEIDLAKKEASVDYSGKDLDIKKLNKLINPFGFVVKDRL